ncbi:unnamed protein product [Caenorhabditis bovis]|uniref:Uncharacterized protein n=1 Tax=Caenorhabditis bovis TaxID=2654633 RepID=A0A8S1F5B4_9PELO|nr:unnamed protein product [Caenorhabditis bovis]
MVKVIPKVINSPYPRSRLPMFLYSVSIYFPMVAAPTIMIISLTWLITALYYVHSPCTLAYNFMEMPSAVFCSLLSGISAVIEIHFSIDAMQVQWVDQSFWIFTVSTALCLLHAMVAFALQ